MWSLLYVFKIPAVLFLAAARNRRFMSWVVSSQVFGQAPS